MRKIMNNTRRPSALQAISFLTGAALMVFELVAARILAPTIGSSNYIWTSVIGVIIAALSIGYWVGGLYADKRNKASDVILLCLGTAALVVVTTLAYLALLESIVASQADVRIQAVVASVFLFAPVSFVLGSIHSYLAKLAIVSLETSGQSVAGLSALNSVGGIIGTFVTGFVLFNFIGSRETMAIVVGLLLLSSWLLLPRTWLVPRLIATVTLLALSLIPLSPAGNVVADIDSSSAHYRIIDTLNSEGTDTRLLLAGPGAAQSGINKQQPNELLFWYAQFAAQRIQEESPENILVLGGGVFTLPSYLAKAHPDSQVDAVEIDPKLESIAKQYFDYEPQPNLKLVFQDARTYVNQTDKKYDVVIVDVYSDTTIPFSFVTREFGEGIDRITAEGGRVIVNVIAGDSSACRAVKDSLDAVYRPHFSNGYWQTESGAEVGRGNYLLLYSRSAEDVPMYRFRSASKTVYTDNFAPVDQLQFKCAQ